MDLETLRILDPGSLEPRKRLPVYGGEHFIVLPSAVKLASLPPIVERGRGQEKRATLTYTFPAELIPQVIGYFRPETVVIDTPPQQSMEPADHYITFKAPGLLKDFRSLAHKAQSPNIGKRVRAFAAKWGPLWLCQNPDHGDCLFSSDAYWRTKSPCRLFFREEVQAFVRKACQADAVLEAAIRLQQMEPVPEELWVKMNPMTDWTGELHSQNPLGSQAFYLSEVINRHLKAPSGLSIGISWGMGFRLTLRLSTQFGFLAAVWLEIAQTIAQARGLFWCDECWRPYVRKGRKPKRGERNYCPTCGERGKASKRQSWSTHHKQWPSQITHRGSIDNNSDNNLDGI